MFGFTKRPLFLIAWKNLKTYPVRIFLTTSSIILGVASFVPGGIGVSEGTLIGLLSIHGLTFSTAVSLTIFIRIFTLWYAVLVGLIALKFTGAFSINNSTEKSS